uniref:Transcriptional regulator n=1 Tax=Globodera pallida TaxID=36090 RepID=A0A183CKA9_GLOPA
MQNLLSLLQLYNDDGLQMIHERLRDPISDTLSQLQSAIRQEKTARAGRHDVDVDADYANYGLFERRHDG